jgi:hypothetical protein
MGRCVPPWGSVLLSPSRYAGTPRDGSRTARRGGATSCCVVVEQRKALGRGARCAKRRDTTLFRVVFWMPPHPCLPTYTRMYGPHHLLIGLFRAPNWASSQATAQRGMGVIGRWMTMRVLPGSSLPSTLSTCAGWKHGPSPMRLRVPRRRSRRERPWLPMLPRMPELRAQTVNADPAIPAANCSRGGHHVRDAPEEREVRQGETALLCLSNLHAGRFPPAVLAPKTTGGILRRLSSTSPRRASP